MRVRRHPTDGTAGRGADGAGGAGRHPHAHATPHFAHVFAGDSYAAGYYSYMWSEVMDADAFAAFAETGDIFDPATARRLEETILSKGGSAPADQLWMAFRGRMRASMPC